MIAGDDEHVTCAPPQLVLSEFHMHAAHYVAVCINSLHLRRFPATATQYAGAPGPVERFILVHVTHFPYLRCGYPSVGGDV